jgi:hypothetical protein
MVERVEQRKRERHWPKAEIRDDKLLVEGERYAFIRGLNRQIRLLAGKLILERTIEIDESRTRRIDRLSGLATIENDRLAIAGVKTAQLEAQEVFVSIRSAPEEEKKFHWNASFGIVSYESETGLEDGWSCEIYLPARVFNEMLVAYAAGNVDNLRIACATDMWVRDGMQLLPNLPSDAKVAWFLAPPLDSAEHPGIGRGKVQNLSWFEPVEPKSQRADRADNASGRASRSQTTRTLHLSLTALVVTMAALVAMAAWILVK